MSQEILIRYAVQRSLFFLEETLTWTTLASTSIIKNGSKNTRFKQ